MTGWYFLIGILALVFLTEFLDWLFDKWNM